jgi:hypothetical protein
MQTFSANEAKTQFGQIIDLAQREPVRVMRRDRAVDITVLAQDCEAMRELFANRLKHTLLEPAPLTSLQIISAQQAYAVLGI